MQGHQQHYLPRIVIPSYRVTPHSPCNNCLENNQLCRFPSLDSSPQNISRTPTNVCWANNFSEALLNVPKPRPYPYGGMTGMNFFQCPPMRPQFNRTHNSVRPSRIVFESLQRPRGGSCGTPATGERFSKLERNIFEDPKPMSPIQLTQETGGDSSFEMDSEPAIKRNLNISFNSDSSEDLDDSRTVEFSQKEPLLPRIETRTSTSWKPKVILLPFEDDLQEDFKIGKSILKKDGRAKYSLTGSGKSFGASPSSNKSCFSTKVSTFSQAVKTKRVGFFSECQ